MGASGIPPLDNREEWECGCPGCEEENKGKGDDVRIVTKFAVETGPPRSLLSWCSDGWNPLSRIAGGLGWPGEVGMRPKALRLGLPFCEGVTGRASEEWPTDVNGGGGGSCGTLSDC